MCKESMTEEISIIAAGFASVIHPLDNP